MPTRFDSPPALLTYQEVSTLFGLKIGTLYSLVARGAIPHVRLGRRLVRFPEQELRKWLEGKFVEPAPPAGTRAKELAS